MHSSPPLLPHREHGNNRHLWMDPDLSLVQVLELLATYDTELADINMAQGAATPPPSLMDTINIVAIAPAALLPNPPNQTTGGRPPPPRTTTYLLFPRASAMMVDPPPMTACLPQAGPFSTFARLEVRTDGYFMEDIRTFVRSARGSEAPFAHPRIVRLADYTIHTAATAQAQARTPWTHEEPSSIRQPKPSSGINQPAPPQGNV
jgi:hypothetical protein